MLSTTISSGKFKGQKILLPSLNTTRSTKSLVKGSFFDTTRFILKNKIFIECFGGSALMAIEALSNGAKKIVVIEKDKDAYLIAKKNLQNFKDFEIYNSDCFLKLNSLLNSTDEFILYLDPPFNIRDGFDDIYKKVLDLISGLDKFNINLICIEHISNITFDEIIGKFKLKKSKKFGKTRLSYYERY